MDRQHPIRLPWTDRSGRFSAGRCGGFALGLAPAVDMTLDLSLGSYGPMPVHGLLYWSGVWATALLLLALAVTPLRAVLHWNGMIAARRPLGVASLLYTIVHVLAYFALDDWELSRVGAEMLVLSPSVVTATLSALGLLALGATSSDAAVRHLGSAEWIRVHRLVHATAILAVAHFLFSRGIFAAQYVSAGVLFWLLVWRSFDVGSAPGALLRLALVSAVFTACLEAAWMSLLHRAEFTAVLGDNLDLTAAPAVQVLCLGLAVAAASFAARRPGLA